MADMVFYAALQTTDMGNLVIEDKTDPTCPYSLVRNGIGPGTGSTRKVSAQSPFVHGRQLVHAVPDMGAITLQVRIRGATFDWLDYYTSQLLLFLNDHFHLRIDINGTTHQWSCEQVDNWSIGDPSGTNTGNWDDVSLRSFTQVLTAQTLRQPGNVLGRF